MSTLYDRRVVLEIRESPPNNYVVQPPYGLRVTDLRTTFKVERTLLPTPNTFEVSVFNLDETSRARLAAQKHTGVTVLAGWADGVAVVISGDCSQVSSEKIGEDWVTRLRGGEGGRAFKHARVSRSFPPGTKAKDVLLFAVSALTSDPGNLVAMASNRLFASGFVAHGSAATVASEILKADGQSWSIQDGRFEVSEEGSALADEGPLLSPSTGLIGTPSLGMPDKRTGRATTSVRSLLQPRIRPGQRFAVRLKERTTYVERLTDAAYVAQKVTHFGDTHGGDWYTDIEAYPL